MTINNFPKGHIFVKMYLKTSLAETHFPDNFRFQFVAVHVTYNSMRMI